MFLKNLRSLKAGFQLFSVDGTLFCGKYWLATFGKCDQHEFVTILRLLEHILPLVLYQCTEFSDAESIFFVIFAFYFRSYSPFWDGKVCLESLPVYSLSPINMIESGTVKKITGWTFVSGDKPIRVCLCYIVFYYTGIHTKIYSLKSYVINFYTPMSSNQSESWSMSFFYIWEKWYVQWNATAMHEFRSKFPTFVWACSTFAVP